MQDFTDMQKIASQMRRDVLRMVHGAQSGHPGAALGCAEFFTLMYFSMLRHKPNAFTMEGKGQDMFFLSNGHLSAIWYSALARSGYFGIEELGTFRKLNSRLQGHPATAEQLPGVRIASGSLGQGLSVAIGAAIAKKLQGDPYLVYVLLGDGELQEGQVWEAAMFAAARETDNLIAVVDSNGKQIDGPVEKVLSLGDLKAKWLAFGWEVLETDGNDFKKLSNSLNQAVGLSRHGRPVVILMKTIMGKGVDFMEDRHEWHGSPPNDEQFQRAIVQIEETLGDF